VAFFYAEGGWAGGRVDYALCTFMQFVLERAGLVGIVPYIRTPYSDKGAPNTKLILVLGCRAQGVYLL
jgi:hypothetical protein